MDNTATSHCEHDLQSKCILLFQVVSRPNVEGPLRTANVDVSDSRSQRFNDWDPRWFPPYAYAKTSCPLPCPGNMTPRQRSAEAEDDVVFCHGNKAISAYYIIRGVVRRERPAVSAPFQRTALFTGGEHLKWASGSRWVVTAWSRRAPFWTSPSLRAVLFFQASTNWPPRANFIDVDVCASAVLQLLGAFLGRHTTRRFIPWRNDPKGGRTRLHALPADGLHRAQPPSGVDR